MIRAFECTNDHHNKFWTVEIIETDDDKLLYNFIVKTTYGKIGTKSQESYKTYWTKEEAYREASRLVKSKKKKGYIENR
ncbi:hypothetical protein LCGC14_1981290 [marine sediment metagenome]|uniref:WGR domain-containing protein n=1 Tax=marine sediment metagenome TaxID=412755 RepID=A0A0F9F951_9ZZZZ